MEQEKSSNDPVEVSTVFVGNVPYKTDWREFKTFFSKFGAINFVNCVRHVATGRRTGSWFIKFKFKESVEKIKNASEEELTIGERVVRIGDPKILKKPKKPPPSRRAQWSKHTFKEGPMSRLNDDCLTHILTFLEPVKRIQLQRVNKTWYRCVLMAAARQKHLVVRKPMDRQFGFISERQICRIIYHCHLNLTALDLSLVSKQVEKAVVETISGCCAKLTYLNLSGAICVSNLGIAIIASKCPELKWLIVNNCPRITEKGVWSILKHCKHLERLHCKGNKFTGKCFRLSPPTLKELVLKDCQDLSQLKDGVEGLAQTCSNLTRLDLNNCQLEDSTPVADVLKNATSLKDLDIGHFTSLRRDPSVEPVMSLHVVHSVARPEILTRLMLDNTGLRDEDLTFVCSSCPLVTELDISCNHLSDISVTQLSALTELKVLSLCHLFKVTSKALIDVISVGSLTKLCMQGCKSVDDSLFEVMSIHCHHLQELDIAGVENASPRALSALSQAWQDRAESDKLVIYAFHNAFLDCVEPPCLPGLSLRVIYRRLYPTHSSWVVEGEDEPHNVVINRRWDPDEFQESLEAAMGLGDKLKLEAGLPHAAALPAELVDSDEWLSQPDDDDCEFLSNDDPLEQERYNLS